MMITMVYNIYLYNYNNDNNNDNINIYNDNNVYMIIMYIYDLMY